MNTEHDQSCSMMFNVHVNAYDDHAIRLLNDHIKVNQQVISF